MSFFGLIFQIGELFKGNFNWRGVYHLALFIVMFAIIAGFAGFLGYKAFRTKK